MNKRIPAMITAVAMLLTLSGCTEEDSGLGKDKSSSPTSSASDFEKPDKTEQTSESTTSKPQDSVSDSSQTQTTTQTTKPEEPVYKDDAIGANCGLCNVYNAGMVTANDSEIFLQRDRDSHEYVLGIFRNSLDFNSQNTDVNVSNLMGYYGDMIATNENLYFVKHSVYQNSSEVNLININDTSSIRLILDTGMCQKNDYDVGLIYNLVIYDDYLYYCSNNSIFRRPLNEIASNIAGEIIVSGAREFSISDGCIFYPDAARNNAISAYNISNGDKAVISDTSATSIISVDKWIYFLSVSDKQLCRIRNDGSSLEILVDDDVYTYNYYKDKIYYSYYQGVSSVNPDGSGMTSIIDYTDEVIYNLHIAGDFLFFNTISKADYFNSGNEITRDNYNMKYYGPLDGRYWQATHSWRWY